MDVSVRTLMTVASGATQGWSFSLGHRPLGSFQYYGGDVSLTAVSTEGTQTETVKNGGPPDFNETHIQPGFDGYTQGVMVDNSQAITLPPTYDFVTSKACYSFTMPYYGGYYTVDLTFTHDIGEPEIRSVVTQDGESTVPCQRKFTFIIFVSTYMPPSPTSCWASAASQRQGNGQARPVASAAAGSQRQGAQGSCGPGQPQIPACQKNFRRGDANGDGNVDISDPTFILDFLFRGGQTPLCKDAADGNDDELLDISDPIFVLSFLFLGGAAPPAPFVTCGDDPTEPGVDLGCEVGDTCGADTDQDGLSDDCEALTLGTNPMKADSDDDSFTDLEEILSTGVNGLNIRDLWADPRRPDLYVEIDWFELQGDHDHKPLFAALETACQSFDDAGITLHIDAGVAGALNLPAEKATGGEAIVFTDPQSERFVTGVPDEARMWCEVFCLKNVHFAPEREDVFHYSLWTHYAWPGAADLYGLARRPRLNGEILTDQAGETFIGFFHEDIWGALDANQDGILLEPNGDRQEADRFLLEGGGFMHELGHNVGLFHGGFEEKNGKPNYSSVMNYRFMVRGVDWDCDWRPERTQSASSLDYSDGTRAVVDETALNETTGMCGVFVDWNGNMIDDGAIPPRAVRGDRDLCGLPEPPPDPMNACAECEAAGEFLWECGCPHAFCGPETGMMDFDDWTFVKTQGMLLGAPRNFAPEPPCCDGEGGGAGGIDPGDPWCGLGDRP
jgi:hypothetical protein